MITTTPAQAEAALHLMVLAADARDTYRDLTGQLDELARAGAAGRRDRTTGDRWYAVEWTYLRMLAITETIEQHGGRVDLVHRKIHAPTGEVLATLTAPTQKPA